MTEEAATTLRTRLILAFAYILLTVTIALEIPLALNLQRRAEAELESQSLAQAQVIASVVGNRQAPSDELTRVVEEAERAAGGRVIVVNGQGALIADSAGQGLLGEPYATRTRPEVVAALRQGVPGTRIGRSETLDEEILATAAPILVDGRPIGAVRITQPTTELRASVRRTLVGVVAIGIGGLVAGLLIALVLAGSLSRPLRRLSHAAARLGAGELDVRAGRERGTKEIRDMAAAFDEMAERLEGHVRAQREFAGNASHQLRTPLTGLKLRLESASAKAPPELRRDLEAAEREADRMSAIVDRLLTLARRVETGEPAEVDVADALDRAAARWRERAEAAGATIRALGVSSVAAADPHDVGQMLDNLLDNAIKYAPGEIVATAGLDGDRVKLVVADSGPGIPPDDLERVTERFARGRGASPGGSGLGLAVVRELAERWGGTMTVRGGDAGGTTIEVLLPRV